MGAKSRRVFYALRRAKLASTFEVAAGAKASKRSTWEVLHRLRARGLVDRERRSMTGPGGGNGPHDWWLTTAGALLCRKMFQGRA